MTVREATPADRAAIYRLNLLAFSGEAEGKLTEALVAQNLALVELVAELVAEDVAENAGGIAGHILFTRLTLTAEQHTVPAAALAPMCVLPARQRQGIGSALVKRGLELCAARGCAVVLVVGHPEYYPRFGFSATLGQRIRCEYAAFGDAWMALELTPGALDGITASVEYPQPFRDV